VSIRLKLATPLPISEGMGEEHLLDKDGEVECGGCEGRRQKSHGGNG
jgi:hypothetical protein